MSVEAAKQKIVVHLSSHWIKDQNDMLYIVDALKDYVGYFRLDLGLITSFGPLQAAHLIQNRGGKVFLGLDLDDSTSSIKRAILECRRAGVAITTVSASIGPRALKQVIKDARAPETLEEKDPAKKIMVFSNLSPHFFESSDFSIVYGDSARVKVNQFADWTKDAELDGIILSSRYLDLFKNGLYKNLTKMVFDVRLNEERANKNRVTLPISVAARNGGNMFIVGHPIIDRETGKPNPEAAKKFSLQIASALP